MLELFKECDLTRVCCPPAPSSLSLSHQQKAYNIEQQSVKSGKDVNGMGKSVLLFLPEQ